MKTCQRKKGLNLVVSIFSNFCVLDAEDVSLWCRWRVDAHSWADMSLNRQSRLQKVQRPWAHALELDKPCIDTRRGIERADAKNLELRPKFCWGQELFFWYNYRYSCMLPSGKQTGHFKRWQVEHLHTNRWQSRVHRVVNIDTSQLKTKGWPVVTSDHVQLAHNSRKLLRNLLAAISLFLFYLFHLDPIQIIEESGFPRSQAI